MSLTKDWTTAQAPYLVFWRPPWSWTQGSGDCLNRSQYSCTLLNWRLYCHEAHATTGFILTSKTVTDLLRLPSCHAPHLRTQAENIGTASQRLQCCPRKLLPTGCDSPYSSASLLDQATSCIDAVRTPSFRTFASSRSTSRSKTPLRTVCWRSWDTTTWAEGYCLRLVGPSPFFSSTTSLHTLPPASIYSHFDLSTIQH